MNKWVSKMKTMWKNILFCVSILMNADRRSFVSMGILTLVTSLLPLITAYITKILLDKLSTVFFQQTVNFFVIVLMLMGYVASTALGSIATFWLSKREMIHIQSMLRYLNVGVMNKSVLLDVASFDIPERYESFKRGKNNVLDFQRIVFDTMHVICSLFSLVFSVLILSNSSLLYMVLAICFCVPKAIWMEKRKLGEYRFQKQIAIEEKRKNYYFEILFQKRSAIEIKYNSVDGIIFEKYKKLLEDLNATHNRFELTNNLKTLLIKLPDRLLLTMVTIDYAFRAIYGNVTIGEFSYCVQIFESFLNSINYLNDNLATYVALDEKISEYKKFFEKEEAVNKGNREIYHIQNIKFQNVTFTYPGNEEAALRDVSFEIQPDERVYLVGYNGSGKSTIIKLLCGFYSVDSGVILINDYPIEEYNMNQLRDCITAVFQDYVTYSLSLRESICFDDKQDEIRDKAIKESLNQACMDLDSIEGLEIDSFINKEFHEDGYELSGGQKQKIAVARAFFRNATLHLMDEPTAALDPEAESRLLSRLLIGHSACMTIVVSHCLANAKEADKVIFLNDGEILGVGTHAQLCLKVPEYKHFYEVQKRKYV
jgi:ATP-binding cassette subfamily C protein